MVNVWGAEVPALLPLGLTTVTNTGPAVATLEAGTVTKSCVEVDAAVGVSDVLPKLTLALFAKFEPVRVKLNEPAQVVVDVGLMDNSVGPAATAVLDTEAKNRNRMNLLIRRSPR